MPKNKNKKSLRSKIRAIKQINQHYFHLCEFCNSLNGFELASGEIGELTFFFFRADDESSKSFEMVISVDKLFEIFESDEFNEDF